MAQTQTASTQSTQTTSTSPTPKLNPQAMKILTDFKKQPNVTDENHDVLLAAIHSSPFLIEQFNKAASATDYPLKGLSPLTDPNMGGV